MNRSELKKLSGKELFSRGYHKLKDGEITEKQFAIICKEWLNENNDDKITYEYVKENYNLKELQKIIIHEPIWSTNSIGIAEDKLIDDLEVEIDYKKSDGTRLYPNTFFLSKIEAMEYPSQIIKGIKLKIIPIKDLKSFV